MGTQQEGSCLKGWKKAITRNQINSNLGFEASRTVGKSISIVEATCLSVFYYGSSSRLSQSQSPKYLFIWPFTEKAC